MKSKILIAFIFLLTTISIGSYLFISNRIIQEAEPPTEDTPIKNETPTPTASESSVKNPVLTEELFVHGFGEINEQNTSVKFEIKIPVKGER